MIQTITQHQALIDTDTGEVIDPPVELFGFEVTPVSLQPTREIDLSEWGACWDALTTEYKRLERKATWIQFAIGDLLVFGEAKFGEQIWNFIGENDYAYETVRNFKSVAAKIPASRRNDALTYKHHAVIAALPAPKQTEWLDRAQMERLSANALYEQTRAEKGVPPKHTATCPNCGTTFEI